MSSRNKLLLLIACGGERLERAGGEFDTLPRDNCGAFCSWAVATELEQQQAPRGLECSLTTSVVWHEHPDRGCESRKRSALSFISSVAESARAPPGRCVSRPSLGSSRQGKQQEQRIGWATSTSRSGGDYRRHSRDVL